MTPRTATERFASLGSPLKLLKFLRKGETALALVTGLVASACSVNELTELTAVPTQNQCQENRDCESRLCDTSLGACVAPSGDINAVVLEVTPPASVRGYGGLSFFEVKEGLTHSSNDMEVMIPTPTHVTGRLLATQEADRSGCSNAGETTIATQVTFTPAQNMIGLSAISYRSTSQLNSGEQVFEVLLPGGEYDVYLEPVMPAGDAGAVGAGCEFVPQLSRGVQINGERLELTLSQAVPQPLQVVVASQARFDGWMVDLIHPVTGQLLSTRVPLELHQSADAPVDYRALISYSIVTGSDYSPTGQELVRLTPPLGSIAPVVLMHRAGLEIFSPGKAVIEQLQPFGAGVDFEAWVLQEGNAGEPVPGTVTFSATTLVGLPEGVFASFEVTARVEADGQVRAKLLPGDYRVRTVPDTGSGYAASQTEITVLPAVNSAAPQAVQAGQVIEVHPAVQMVGRLSLPAGIESVVGATVIAEPAAFTQSCSTLDAGAALSPVCRVASDPVLSVALAEDPFVPRRVVGMVSDTARFAVDELDCGACAPGNGAQFDVSVRPPQSSRLPWLLKPGVRVESDVDLGSLNVGLPIVHQGLLRVASTSCEASPESCVMPGALVRAFLVLDDLGAVVHSPANLPSCSVVAASIPAAGASGSPARCARSILQIAETRASDTGAFELLIPAGID